MTQTGLTRRSRALSGRMRRDGAPGRGVRGCSLAARCFAFDRFHNCSSQRLFYRGLIACHKDMVVDSYLPAVHSEVERVANVAFKVYFVAGTEFLIRAFVPPADLSYRY